MLIIILAIIILLSVLLLGPVFFMAGARVLRIGGAGFKQALTVSLVLAAAGVVFIPVSLLLVKFGLSIRAADVICFFCLVPIGIWLVKKKFDTSYLRSAGVYLIGTALSIILAVMVAVFVVQSFVIPPKGTSMEPSVMAGDMVFANKYIYRFRDLRRGELAVFHPPHDRSKSFVKRVVAFPGEQLEIRGGTILIDGKPMEPAVIDAGSTELAPLTVPEGKYFLLGENLENSYDSRYFGAVPREDIFGRLAMVVWSRDPETGDIRWDRFLKTVE